MGRGGAEFWSNGAVTLGKRSTEGFFHVDVTTRLSRRNDHVVMLVDPSRTNGNHVEFFLREHFSKIRIDSLGVRSFLSCRAPFRVLIGKRDNVNIRQFRKSDIDAVSIVPFARPANDSHSNALGSGGSSGSAELRSQDSRSDSNRTLLQEFAPGSSLHVIHLTKLKVVTCGESTANGPQNREINFDRI
jgi:hypothetical protein